MCEVPNPAASCGAMYRGIRAALLGGIYEVMVRMVCNMCRTGQRLWEKERKGREVATVRV